MIVMLQDASMFLSLGIRGHPVIGSAISEGWRGRVEEFLGAPPPAPQGKEARRGRVSGVSLRWLRERFAECPQDADEGTGAWVLNLFGSVLFPDTTGDCFVDVHPLPVGLGRCRYVSVQPMLMSHRIVGYEC
jgi:hypothetical protein